MNYEFDSNLFLIIINLTWLKINFEIFDYKNFRSKKKYKLNLEIITYYY